MHIKDLYIRQKNYIFSILGLGTFFILVYTLTQFIAWPEMLYEPYLMGRGFMIYRDITIAHSPLLLTILQFWYKLFTDYILALRLFTLIVMFVNGLSLWYISLGWFKKLKLANLSWFLYILISCYFEGNGLWFDHAVAFFGLWSFYFFYNFLFKHEQSKHIFFAGLFLGLGGITKQTAGWLVFPSLFGFAILLWQLRSIKIWFRFVGVYLTGVLLPWSVMILFLAMSHNLYHYWYWSLHFGVGILPRSEGQIEPPLLRQLIGTFSFFIVLFPYLWQNRKKAKAWFVVFWTLFAVGGIYPRFERFHFQPALPLLVVIWIWIIAKLRSKTVAIVTMCLPLLLLMRFYLLNTGLPIRFYEDDVQAATQYLKSITKYDQPIYVYDSWDHFYALADRPAAVRPVPPTLKWYLDMPGLEDEVIRTLDESVDPVIIMDKQAWTVSGRYVPAMLDKYIRLNFSEVNTINNRFIILYKNKKDYD